MTMPCAFALCVAILTLVCALPILLSARGRRAAPSVRPSSPPEDGHGTVAEHAGVALCLLVLLTGIGLGGLWVSAVSPAQSWPVPALVGLVGLVGIYASQRLMGHGEGTGPFSD